MRFLSTLLALSTALMGCSSMDETHVSPHDTTAIRVATYNIKHGRGMDGTIDLERTAETLKSMDADIIALQEVDDRARRSGDIDQASWLADRLGMHAAYGSFMDFQGGRYGLALLSRRPFLSHEAWRLADGNEPRVALAADIPTDSGDPITVISVHFDWVEDDGYRFEQARDTIRRIGTLQTPWIVLGDFNDVPGSRTMVAFKNIGRNAAKPAEDSATFPSDHPEIEIDHIIMGPEGAWMPTTSLVIPESRTSDHRPVVSELIPIRN